MARLTKRSSGITDGYVSNYRRDDLLQKLGQIEHRSEDLIGQMCEHYCRHREEANELGLEFICESCPMTRLMEMID